MEGQDCSRGSGDASRRRLTVRAARTSWSVRELQQRRRRYAAARKGDSVLAGSRDQEISRRGHSQRETLFHHVEKVRNLTTGSR